MSLQCLRIVASLWLSFYCFTSSRHVSPTETVLARKEWFLSPSTCHGNKIILLGNVVRGENVTEKSLTVSSVRETNESVKSNDVVI